MGMDPRFCPLPEISGAHAAPQLYDPATWLPAGLLLVIGAVLAVALLIASRVIAVHNPEAEKISPYECGFNAFEDSRMKFDVHFYLVSLLFIIFDLEIAFLFPWAVALPHLGAFGFVSMMLFLATLTVGFVYEWRSGALDWE